MEQIRRFLNNHTFVFQPATPLARTVVCTAIALCMVTLAALHLTQINNQRRLDDLTAQAAQITQQNQDLQNRIDGLGTVASYKQIAAEQLGLVDPDTIVIESE